MIKDLVYYNSPFLRKRCKEVEKIDDDVRRVVQDLKDSVGHYNGAGLAAPQIGYLVRAFVICFAHEEESDGSAKLCPPQVFINPEILSESEEEVVYPEGCLSIPGLTEDVVRTKEIKIRAMDLNGKVFEEVASGWRARVILHEFDHLNGTLFIDRLSEDKRAGLDQALQIISSQFNTKKH